MEGGDGLYPSEFLNILDVSGPNASAMAKVGMQSIPRRNINAEHGMRNGEMP